MPNNSFTTEVANKLGTYVYRLIDPRNGETFYVGKGTGDRVFAHVSENISTDDPSHKLRRIREIKLSGFEVAHVIHRHGMDEKTAFEVEAALMDAYQGLTNVAGGIGSIDYGVMHADEIIKKYTALEADFTDIKALLINVNRSAMEISLYEATRYAWKVAKAKASKAEVILSVIQGTIVGAFVAKEWLDATTENFPNRDPMLNRFAFEGNEANEGLKNRFIGKRIPAEYRRRGAANPIKYTWN